MKIRHFWWLGGLLLSFLPCAGALRAADHTSLPFVTVPVQVSPQGDLDKYWRTGHSELREKFTATWGFVDVENVSNTPMEGARFYGEYFDADGRFCFSLAFSQTSNDQGRIGLFRPGEVRTLLSMAGFLGAAVQPKELRLYLLQQRRLGGHEELFERETVIRAPITIGGGIPADQSFLRLTPELSRTNGSLLDLVFARVSVDITGHLEKVEVLKSMNGTLESWFPEFISHLKFFPANKGDVPEAGSALILLRAAASREVFLNSAFLARDSAWVSSYVAAVNEREVPPVTTLLFERPPTRVKRPGSVDWVELPPSPPGLFQFFSSGSAWCPDLFLWKSDPVSGRLRREWNLPVAAPGDGQREENQK